MFFHFGQGHKYRLTGGQNLWLDTLSLDPQKGHPR